MSVGLIKNLYVLFKSTLILVFGICTTPVMISEDTLKEIVFNEIGQHIEKAVALSKEIEQMTMKEIIHLFTKKILAWHRVGWASAYCSYQRAY